LKITSITPSQVSEENILNAFKLSALDTLEFH